MEDYFCLISFPRKHSNLIHSFDFMEFCFGNQRFKAAQLAAELIYVVLIDKQVLSGSEAVMHPKIAVPIADLSHDC